ncbi:MULTISPECIES: hydrolase 2, exosortase A system-associated [unclassified Janthinobacterium]|uniref:hydrolase 2, exosortase A system-associated n=1 Tax=unclassified Janthinobacterium TaxID=2610881 RepID=UPI00160DE69F|nr:MULTISPECIES: hydrolase 2, exosortase A system-associated [unclassified Janthinobacterium]MBB5369840.1 exosortase A-associated hydrolase 2 [Janthinobacterium sp. K2C7]MBB5382646.1 exosortase A-associated hydrolase 2 [Janthinobacterium sp. K2Li3]MBB5384631.1 exosortase A-associated hydrolase 2 [Janthinobacterium sp. K2E3]
MTRSSTSLLPFFLPASGGQRYCLLHLPAPESGQKRPPRGGIVYLHPFAEELNKSRRVAALQARAFADAGYSVLQIDLHGCGDSSGDFADARWAIWRNDVHLACAWLQQRVSGPLTLWGLRLGALLALDIARHPPVPLARLLLWQPELSGRRSMDQFLRLRLAARMLADNGQKEAPVHTHAQLAAGQNIEVAGYTLAPELVHAIDDIDAARLAPTAPAVPVYWLEYSASTATLPAPAARLVQQWRSEGAQLHIAAFDDGAFWSSAEIMECPQLLQATRQLCGDWLTEPGSMQHGR